MSHASWPPFIFSGNDNMYNYDHIWLHVQVHVHVHCTVEWLRHDVLQQSTPFLHRNKSMELKRSASLPSPSPPPPPTPPPSQSPRLHKSPPLSQTHHFRQPRVSRRPLGPKSLNPQRRNGQTRHRYQRSHSMQNNVRNVLEDLDHSFPSLSKSPGVENSHATTRSTPPQGISYAQATGQPRASKRTTSDRNCISPTPAPSKRSAVYGTVVTPTALKQSSKCPLMQDPSTTLPWGEEEDEEVFSTPREGATEDMDTSTPDNNRYMGNRMCTNGSYVGSRKAQGRCTCIYMYIRRRVHVHVHVC